MRARKRLFGFIAVIQSILWLAHLLLYKTWTFSPTGNNTHGAFWIRLCLGFLSVSFVTASLLAFRYTNALLRAFYRAAAVWVGLLTFLLPAAVFSWLIAGQDALGCVERSSRLGVALAAKGDGTAAVTVRTSTNPIGTTRITHFPSSIALRQSHPRPRRPADH